MNKDKALKMALGNLLQATRHLGVCPATVEAAESALAQPEQEPVARIGMINEDHFSDVCRKANGDSNTPLYITSPKREWVGLTDEDRLCAKYLLDAPEGIDAVIEYIEAKLKELNHD